MTSLSACQFSLFTLVVRYTGSGKTHTVLGSDGEEGLYYKVGVQSKTVNAIIIIYMIFIMIIAWSNPGSRGAAEQTKDRAAR